MQKSHFSLALLVSLLAAIVLVTLDADIVRSVSVDLAHHYALTFRIAETWQLVPNDPTLGEMNYYPRLSHLVAAVAGTLFGSPFVGLQLVTLGSLALMWAACFAVLYTLPVRAALPAAAALAGLVWLNASYLGFDLHGAEITGNFFFSQLFAQALCMLAIAFAIRLDAHRPRPYVYGFLVLADYVVMQAHLLPALELLGVLVGLVALDNLTFKGPLRKRAELAAVSLLTLAAAFFSVVFSPAFTAMRQISENNGRLVLQHLDGPYGLLLLCLAGLAIALVLLFCWLRGADRHPVFKFMALYGGAVSALCLLQSFLLRFHLGSEYAVKKYAFGISSFVLVAIALLAGVLAGRMWKAATKDLAIPAPLSAAAVAAALSISFLYCAPVLKLGDASDIAALERQLLTLRDTTLLPPVEGKTDMVIDLGRQSDVVNYMFAIGIIHTPRAIAGPDLLLGYKLGPFEQYRTIISSRDGSRYSGRNCATSDAGPLLTIDAACLKKAVIEASVCKQTLDFAARGDLESSMLTGFSVAEQSGRWTDSHKATVTCTVQKPFSKATLVAAPFLAGGHPRQRVLFSVNGGQPVQHEFTAPSNGTPITLPLPPLKPGEQMKFTIDLPDAVSPQQLGIGADGRRLGVTVLTLSFE